MSITNEDRYHLQERANEVLGEKEGAILMELLPPVGWADVATKRDLDQLEGSIGQAMTTGFAEQNAALQTDLRKIQGVLLSAMVGLATLITAILAIAVAVAS